MKFSRRKNSRFIRLVGENSVGNAVTLKFGALNVISDPSKRIQARWQHMLHCTVEV